MNRIMWRSCAGAIAALAVVLSGSQAFAQAKTEIALSRQRNTVQKWGTQS